MSSPLRHRLFRAGFAALSAVAADRWLAPVARGRGVILTFHHVLPEPPAAFAPNALLTITPGFLDRTLTLLRVRGFDLVGLDAVPALLRDGAPRPFAVLTFDDGYRDNLEHAVPVLRRHDAPWTLFVTTDFADGRGRLWWRELEAAVARLDRVRLPARPGRPASDARALDLPALDLPALDLPALDLPARDPAEKDRAFAAAYRRLRAGPEEDLLADIAALCGQAGVPVGADARAICLSWDALRALSDDPSVTFGAHTLTHPMLAKHDTVRVREEIARSRARIAAELGRPVRHLSYPVGDPTSAGAREFAIARDLGFDTAVTTRPGHLFPVHAAHRHALPRVSVNGLHQTQSALSGLVSGVPFLVWNRGRRLSVA